MMKKQDKKKALELLRKACPAVFGRDPIAERAFPLQQITPRGVCFQIPPEIFSVIKKWRDLDLPLELAFGCRDENCQIFIINTEALHEYNKGRDPKKGYPKD